MQRKSKMTDTQIGKVADDLYALAGLADGFTVNKGPDAQSLFSAIDAVIARAVVNLQGDSNKEAMAHFRKSAAALETLAVFLSSLRETREEESPNPSMAFRRMVAAVIKSFTGEAGRWMERGEKAQGAKIGMVGYLETGYLIAGGEDLSIPRYNEAGEAYDALSPEDKRAVLNAMQQLAAPK